MEDLVRVEGYTNMPSTNFPFSKPSPFSSMTDGYWTANTHNQNLQNTLTVGSQKHLSALQFLLISILNAD